jgi:hypothetical protein
MKDGIQRTLKVHKMVAAAFIGPRPDGFHINHKNGIKTDNRVENLEYVTPLENTQHAVRCGLNIYGEASVHAKLTEENVRDILARLATESQRSLGKKFGVSTTTIRKIALGQRWKHVTLDPA